MYIFIFVVTQGSIIIMLVDLQEHFFYYLHQCIIIMPCNVVWIVA